MPVTASRVWLKTVKESWRSPAGMGTGAVGGCAAATVTRRPVFARTDPPVPPTSTDPLQVSIQITGAPEGLCST